MRSNIEKRSQNLKRRKSKQQREWKKLPLKANTVKKKELSGDDEPPQSKEATKQEEAHQYGTRLHAALPRRKKEHPEGKKKWSLLKSKK